MYYASTVQKISIASVNAAASMWIPVVLVDSQEIALAGTVTPTGHERGHPMIMCRRLHA